MKVLHGVVWKMEELYSFNITFNEVKLFVKLI